MLFLLFCTDGVVIHNFLMNTNFFFIISSVLFITFEGIFNIFIFYLIEFLFFVRSFCCFFLFFFSLFFFFYIVIIPGLYVQYDDYSIFYFIRS